MLAVHYKIVLDLDSSMHSTCVPNCWSLVDNVPRFYVRRQSRTVLIRTPCGPILDGLRYPPNRLVMVHEGSFMLLPHHQIVSLLFGWLCLLLPIMVLQCRMPIPRRCTMIPIVIPATSKNHNCCKQQLYYETCCNGDCFNVVPMRI